MNYFYLLMLTALTTTNLSYGMVESKQAQASKEEASHAIMPALEKTREPKFKKIPHIMLKNNTGIETALTLSYEIKDKNKVRAVQTFIDAWQPMPIPASMGANDLTGIQARQMYMGQAAFEPLQLTIVQKALLIGKEAYVSLEDVGGKLVIYVRRYQKKSVKQKAVKSSAPRAQQASVESKRKAEVPTVPASAAPGGPSEK